jgi:hypothetical protein
MGYSDVKSVRTATAAATAVAGRKRLKGIHVAHDAVGAGRVTLTDGSAGATLLDLDFDATAGSDSVHIPADGILFESEIYVSVLTNIIGITIFYTG